MNVKSNHTTLLLATTFASLSIVFSGCANHHPSRDLGQQCTHKLDHAQEELRRAKVDGFHSTVAWSKAAGLITAASIQKQFEKYPNCIDKADRAREYIKESRR